MSRSRQSRRRQRAAPKPVPESEPIYNDHEDESTEHDPAHPLAGCHAKLRRAYKHIQALNESIRDWGGSHPYAFVGYLDPYAGENIIQMAQIRRAPLLDWAVTIGDILHNLRSTLDHLICVMNRQGNPEHPCVATEFPIFVQPDLWEKRDRGGRLSPRSGLAKLGSVDDWTIATVKRNQPFNARKKAPEEEALWVLQKLNVIDKHRTLHLGVTYFYEPEVIRLFTIEGVVGV